MNNAQILQKAIEKAVGNGWNEGIFPMTCSLRREYYKFVFSHEFAKAFWGEEDITVDTESDDGYFEPITHIAWKWYLQIMVLKEDPIKYLEQFL